MADLASDPSYAAYLRALGFDTATAEGNAARQQGIADDQYAFQRPEIQYQGGLDRQQISNGFEDRGMFRSGGRALAIGQQQHGEQAQLGALDLAHAGQVSDIQGALAQQIVEMRRRQAEQDLALAGQQYLQEGTRPFSSTAL